jgi:hypothetical protein
MWPHCQPPLIQNDDISINDFCSSDHAHVFYTIQMVIQLNN